MEAPRESPLPPREREALRARLTAEIPSWYNGYVHLAIPSLFGLAVIVGAILSIHNLHPVELLAIPLIYLLSNATEWRAHRDMLHKRSKIAPVLYDRHTPLHHMIFLTEDMAARSVNEWRYVLIPPYGIMLIALGNAPITYGLWWLGMPNVAALYIATTIGYVVSYEWLHLSFHMPKDSFIGRLALVRILRNHHSIHHDPRLMQRYNFNVTVPLWDFVRRTYVSADQREARSRRNPAAAVPEPASTD